VIQVAEYYAWPLIDSGRLVELLSDYKTEGHDISVVFPQQKRVAPKLRVFVDFLVALFDPPPWKRGAAAVRTRKATPVRSSERATVRIA
jgi:DNA-binding transcriptional LysR family regulator